MRPPNAPEAEAEEPLPTPSLLYTHRTERFVELGFTAVDAGMLAMTKGDDGFPLYHGQAKRLLDAGCSHAQVVAIYA